MLFLVTAILVWKSEKTPLTSKIHLKITQQLLNGMSQYLYNKYIP